MSKKISGASALAGYIGKLTGDGEELVHILLSVARGSAPDKIRLEAVDMLMDRFAGKPNQTIEATITDGPAVALTGRMKALDEAQLEALASLGLEEPAN